VAWLFQKELQRALTCVIDVPVLDTFKGAVTLVMGATALYAQLLQGALQVILVPDLLFLIFLAYTAKRCFDILNRSPSMIMWTYYGLVWTVTLCNVLRTIIQMSVGDNHTGVRLWNVLWIITRFVMTMLEV
jgi:hypothetical protein